MDAPPAATDAPSPDKLRRFNLAIQRTRALVYLLAVTLGVVGGLLGVLQLEMQRVPAIAALALLSCAFFHEAYRLGLDRRLPFGLDPLWMVSDVAITSFGVAISGGIESPWYLWYLTNLGAVAFVAGPRAAVTLAVLTTALYLATLSAMGHVGWLDGPFRVALFRMVVLNTAASFFVRGVVRYRRTQLELRRLQADERLKVEELIRLTQDLDQGTRALGEANLQIREADRVKSQFLANMSHELRTPLNSIIGFSEILLERLDGQVQPKYVRFLNNIHSSGQHLLAIINDILDLSKVEAGKMDIHPEEFRVGPVIEGVVHVMHGMTAKRHITIDVEVPPDLPLLETDPAKFKQVLYNLLSNAVKFSPDHSRVVVRAGLSAPGEPTLAEEAVTVSVIDEGIGIAEADQEIIFQEFRQADGTATRAYGGTGLGLALVKKFVEYQGGVVGLRSELGKGSTFWFTLPRRSRTAAEARAAAEQQWRLPAASRVLVVEDDVAAYQHLARMLSEAGYFPIRARHGQEALEMARLLRPIAITLDLMLPELSGWEVLKELKRDGPTRAIPVVIVSMMDNRELGLALGAQDYFLKPVDRRQLIDRLRQLAPPGRPPAVSRLLLVDDDPAVHELLGADLSLLGYDVKHARSGLEGVELALAERPDAVILDLMMPDQTGFEVADELRAREETAHVPIIILTAKDLTEEERALLRGKIAALVRKGHATPARLVAAIRELQGPEPAEEAGAR